MFVQDVEVQSRFLGGTSFTLALPHCVTSHSSSLFGLWNLICYTDLSKGHARREMTKTPLTRNLVHTVKLRGILGNSVYMYLFVCIFVVGLSS